MKKQWMSWFYLRAHLRDARMKVAIVATMTIFTLIPFANAMANEEGQEEDRRDKVEDRPRRG